MCCIYTSTPSEFMVGYMSIEERLWMSFNDWEHEKRRKVDNEFTCSPRSESRDRTNMHSHATLGTLHPFLTQESWHCPGRGNFLYSVDKGFSSILFMYGERLTHRSCDRRRLDLRPLLSRILLRHHRFRPMPSALTRGANRLVYRGGLCFDQQSAPSWTI